MGFYETIERYYDDIFPTKPVKVDFARRLAQSHDARTLLDIGCATGGFASPMAESMERVDAFDLDDKMIGHAKAVHQSDNLHFRVGNMLELDGMYSKQRFDMVTCFGNTLVHVTPDEVTQIFSHVKRLLTPSGIFILQILNYDYILDEGIYQLPLIDNDVIRFERSYTLDAPKAILFSTSLTVKEDGKTYNNQITLYPMRKAEIMDALRFTGFEWAYSYRNYQGEPAEGTHLPLIIVAR